MWYIWKARDEKLFNNKDITPLDTIQLAISEAESWTIAQRVPEIENIVLNNVTEEGAAEDQTLTPPSWRCQVDASWISNRNILILSNSMVIMTLINVLSKKAKHLWNRGFIICFSITKKALKLVL